MSEGLDWARLDALREQMEREDAARREAAERVTGVARRFAAATGAAGLTVWRGSYVSASRHYGADVAGFWVDDPADGWHAEVCVIPEGMMKIMEAAIRDCRVRLAEQLLTAVSAAARPDGTWPEAETTRAIQEWLLNHGVNPDPAAGTDAPPARSGSPGPATGAAGTAG